MQALIPIKLLDKSKSRLASVLNQAERLALTKAMAQDVLCAVKATPGISNVAIMTEDQAIINLGRMLDCATLPEPGGGLNEGLSRHAERFAEQGVQSLLVLPGDIPALCAADVTQIIAECDAESDSIVLVPAASDGGTNALLCTPPNVITFQFGERSAEKHRGAALAAGARIKTLHIPSIERDIDRPEDLAWLSNSGGRGKAVQFLADIHISSRFDTGRPCTI